VNDALRAALSETGHTTESLAAKVGVDPKTSARWLAEDRIPHARTRATAAAALGREVSDIWPDTARRRELAWFRPWAEIERDATSFRWYEPTVLPGLLQTEAYARAVLVGAGLVARDDVERLLAARLARQGVLRRDHPPQFMAVIDEGVLRRPIGGPAVMREQLRAIVAACAEPHVRVQVVPSSIGAYAGLSGPFVLATTEDHRIAGYLDNLLKGQVVNGTNEIAAILAAWEAIRGEALSHWQSVDLIKEVAETWT
jgi:transcriptional regulator with XRE-family HTH domain